MELSNEDSLRLHVMLANSSAIRIDESKMTVYGLGEHQEYCVRLNANCKIDHYLKKVRELLSTVVLESPRGYPLFISRWIRMDQMNHVDLSKLLLLGENEAIVAIAGSAELTNSLAEKAWWVSPTAENAQMMLKNKNIVNDSMGPILAQYLLEFLPFETESDKILITVALILQDGLISDEKKDKLWLQGKRKKFIALDSCNNVHTICHQKMLPVLTMIIFGLYWINIFPTTLLTFCSPKVVTPMARLF